MKTKTNIDWEKEFEKMWNIVYEDKRVRIAPNAQEVIDFIHALLSHQKADLIQRIEEWAVDHRLEHDSVVIGLLSFLKQQHEE